MTQLPGWPSSLLCRPLPRRAARRALRRPVLSDGTCLDVRSLVCYGGRGLKPLCIVVSLPHICVTSFRDLSPHFCTCLMDTRNGQPFSSAPLGLWKSCWGCLSGPTVPQPPLIDPQLRGVVACEAAASRRLSRSSSPLDYRPCLGGYCSLPPPPRPPILTF